jgi:hypothetical protein
MSAVRQTIKCSTRKYSCFPHPGFSAVVCVRVLVVRQHGSVHESAGPAGVGKNTGSPAMSLSPFVPWLFVGLEKQVLL